MKNIYNSLIVLDLKKAKNHFYLNCSIPLLPHTIILIYFLTDYSKINFVSASIAVIIYLVFTIIFLKNLKDQKELFDSITKIKSIFVSKDKSNIEINKLDGDRLQKDSFTKVNYVVFETERFVLFISHKKITYLIDSNFFKN